MPTSDIVPVACTRFACESARVARAIVSSSAFVPEGRVDFLSDRFQSSAKCVVTRGHGIASGKTPDPRFPGGTLAMQGPFFQALGLDLSSYFPGTLNLSIHPFSFRLGVPTLSFPQVKWSPSLPPENFSFYPCRLRSIAGVKPVEALVYRPHPSTKPGFHQDPRVLEVLAPRIEEAGYGREMEISGVRGSLKFFLSGD